MYCTTNKIASAVYTNVYTAHRAYISARNARRAIIAAACGVHNAAYRANMCAADIALYNAHTAYISAADAARIANAPHNAPYTMRQYARIASNAANAAANMPAFFTLRRVFIARPRYIMPAYINYANAAAAYNARIIDARAAVFSTLYNIHYAVRRVRIVAADDAAAMPAAYIRNVRAPMPAYIGTYQYIMPMPAYISIGRAAFVLALDAAADALAGTPYTPRNTDDAAAYIARRANARRVLYAAHIVCRAPSVRRIADANARAAADDAAAYINSISDALRGDIRAANAQRAANAANVRGAMGIQYDAAHANYIDISGIDAAANAADIAKNPEKYALVSNKKMPTPRCDDIYIIAAYAARGAVQSTYRRDAREFLLHIGTALTKFLYTARNADGYADALQNPDTIENFDAADLLQYVQAALIDAAADAAAAANIGNIDYKKYIIDGIVCDANAADDAAAMPAQYTYIIKNIDKSIIIDDVGTIGTYRRGDAVTISGRRAVRTIAIRAAMRWINAQRAAQYTGIVTQYKKNENGDIIPRRVRVPLENIDAINHANAQRAANASANNEDNLLLAETVSDNKIDYKKHNETLDYIKSILGSASNEYKIIMYIANGYDAAAAAEKMNCGKSKIYKYLSIARKKIVNAGFSYKSNSFYDANAAARIQENFAPLAAAQWDIRKYQNTAAMRAHFAAAASAARRAIMVNASKMPGDKSPKMCNMFQFSNGHFSRITMDDIRRARARRAVNMGLLHTMQKYDFTRRAARPCKSSAMMRYYLQMI